MNLLLDTHALLWFIAGSSELSSTARNAIEDDLNNKFVSIASVWETAIKISIGKMNLTEPFDDLFPSQLHTNGFNLYPISVNHTSVVSRLPFLHRDPFDRILAAVTLADAMTLISGDEVFDKYSVAMIW